jgi:aquaporin Z
VTFCLTAKSKITFDGFDPAVRLTLPVEHEEDAMTAPKKSRTSGPVPAPGSQPAPPVGLEAQFVAMVENFDDRSQEWRRLFSELLGTFFLVLVAAGGGMMGQAFPDTISRTAAVTAPALMVLGVILFMGKISGAHLNPAVSIAFALRGDFPWVRVPGYIVMQLIGATLAAWFLQAVIGVSAQYGSNYPAPGYSSFLAFVMEAVLTFGLVSVILGTASGAQNVGIVGALGVGGYIALAGLWGSPISGASMNPARTFGPTLVSLDFNSYWVYVAGPIAGAVIAVGVAFVLRGRGGGRSGSAAAQGVLFTEVANPGA